MLSSNNQNTRRLKWPNLSESIKFLLAQTGTTLLAYNDDHDDESRINIKLQLGENITNIDIERKRLREINKNNAADIISKINSSLNRQSE